MGWRQIITSAQWEDNSIVSADTSGDPGPLPLAASTFVGRKSSGGVVAMTTAEAEAELTNLSLIDGSRSYTSTVGGVTPTADTHLTTKSYVDALAQGLDVQPSARVATTTDLLVNTNRRLNKRSLLSNPRAWIYVMRKKFYFSMRASSKRNWDLAAKVFESNETAGETAV